MTAPEIFLKDFCKEEAGREKNFCKSFLPPLPYRNSPFPRNFGVANIRPPFFKSL
jgi:hypothetical protein